MIIRKEKKILPIFDFPICLLLCTWLFFLATFLSYDLARPNLYLPRCYTMTTTYFKISLKWTACTVFVFYFSLSWNNRSHKMIPNYTRFPAEMCHPVLHKANATRTVTEREVTIHLMDVVSRLIHDVSRRMIWTVDIQGKIHIVRWILRPWTPNLPEPTKIVSSSRHDLLLWLNLQLGEVGCRQASYSLDWVIFFSLLLLLTFFFLE